MMVLVNGIETDTLSVHDRGLHYGDGLFETISFINGQSLLWERHLNRLQRGCDLLTLPIPEITSLSEEASRVVGDAAQCVVKIILTRGIGGRGYRLPEDISTTRIVASYPWPSYPENYSTEGIITKICKTRILANPQMAGLKHLNRLDNVMACQELDRPDITEGIMLDYHDHVIEGTMTNIYAVKNGKIRTPDLSQCGVAGVMRELIFEIADKLNIGYSVDGMSVDDLEQADEVFLSNSIIGIWPVRQIDEIRYAPGPVTLRLSEEVQRLTR